jgi:hypothetical protein
VNGKETPGILDYYLGVLNSELMNWRFQISNFNNHVSIRELQNLPILEPSTHNNNVSNLLRAVQNRDFPNIEANVFALYGFAPRQARTILEMRRTPVDEMMKILQLLS